MFSRLNVQNSCSKMSCLLPVFIFLANECLVFGRRFAQPLAFGRGDTWRKMRASEVVFILQIRGVSIQNEAWFGACFLAVSPLRSRFGPSSCAVESNSWVRLLHRTAPWPLKLCGFLLLPRLAQVLTVPFLSLASFASAVALLTVPLLLFICSLSRDRFVHHCSGYPRYRPRCLFAINGVPKNFP